MTNNLEKIIKTCKKHGDLFAHEVIKSGINKKTGEQLYKCKACMKDFHKNHYKKHTEKVKASHQRYKDKDPIKHKEMKNGSRRKTWHKHKEVYIQKRIKWDKDNPEKRAAREKRYKDKAIRTLNDRYVKQITVGNSNLKFTDISGDLIDVKRAILKLKRLIKEKQDG